MFRLLRKVFSYLFTYWLGGASVMATYYAVFLATHRGCHVHLYSIRCIVEWPWDCARMLLAYVL